MSCQPRKPNKPGIDRDLLLVEARGERSRTTRNTIDPTDAINATNAPDAPHYRRNDAIDTTNAMDAILAMTQQTQ